MSLGWDYCQAEGISLELGSSFLITASAINTMKPIPTPTPYSRKATRSCSSRRGDWIFYSDWKRRKLSNRVNFNKYVERFLIICICLKKYLFHSHVNNLAFPCLSEPMSKILTQVGVRSFFLFQLYCRTQNLMPIFHGFSSPLYLLVQVHPTTWVHCQSFQYVNSLFW